MLKTIITWVRKWITKATSHPKEPAVQPIKTNIETLHAQAPKTLSEEYLDEKNKVRHRLERWALHQDQINSRILNAYLTLERKGYSPITITMLQNQLLDMKTFLPNFNQMKSIAPHNHAKVFDVRGESVRIWMLLKFMYESMKTRSFTRKLDRLKRFKYENSDYGIQPRKTRARAPISFLFYEGLSSL